MRRRGAVAAAWIAGTVLLGGCTVPGQSPSTGAQGGGVQHQPASPAGSGSDTADGGSSATPGGNSAYPPDECVGVAIGWYPEITIESVTSMPADWPAPPAGSTLCATASGGAVHKATYASELDVTAIFDHYRAAFPASYLHEWTSGQDNGTGYETLDGVGSGSEFQIRETDGGFTLVFARQ